ncbi:hypothetical protein MMC28_002671 [Mycoblastus sanguinarius]|nr:hypothetical protein [Mycoblastus sanguinarius]
MKSLDPPDYNDPEQIDPDIEGNTQYNVSLRWSTFWEKTVLFCEPSYYIQSVNATLMVPNMTVSNIQLLASPQQLPQEQFNIPDFESMVGSDSSKNITGRDINETIKQIDTTQLDNLGVTDLIGNMIIFAVGSEHLELDEYLNPSVLAASLDKAYGLLFALAVNSVLSPNNSNSDNTSGTIQGETNAIAVVRTLAIPLEVCLSLVAIMTILLLLVCWNRRSQLCKDPDSLSNVLELTQNDPKVPSVAKSAEQGCDESGLTLRNGRLRVSAWEENLPISATSTSLTISEHVQGGSSKNKPVRPFVMGTLAGATFLMVLSLALITILALWFCVQNRDGLPIPSRHPLLTQIVLNYLPVVFATLLEPFWTLLNRKLCILKPFEELGNGKARAFQSIDLKYTSLPPQLIIWRALKARHFLLMAVCGIGLSTNILAVALNALLDTQVRAVEFDGTFLKTSLPVINPFPLDTTSSDHLYIAAANFSHGTPLPAWVAEDLFFLPFQINATSPLGSVESYKANTWGFGLVTNCTKIDWDNPGWIAQDKGEVGSPQVNINQSSVECMRLWDTFYESSNKTNGALELIAPFGPNDDKATSEEHEICGSVLTAGFLRAELNAELEGVDSLVTSSQWMTCQSDLVTALYEVEVDNSGRVESYIRQSSDSTDISFAGNASLNSILSNLFLAFDAPFNKQPNWRDGTYEDSWFGFLIKALTKSTKLIDPSLPAPGFYDSSRVVEEVLVRLFPIILSLRPTAFVPAPTGSTIKGKMMVPCDRVFMSRPMFILVVILLLWNIVVAAAYYLYRPRPMPTGVADTIASVLALFDGSGLVKEQSVDRPWPEDWTFGYGNFIGENDGKPRLGIERRPFVVPLVDKKRT